ncbi:hypothetical protein ACFSR9_15225 [Deinococcus taklimakanensis]|uniref:Lipoprotein n=1 Tax=Deinococcus taklimakanensis TaxID=536443 RepID=A0ABW5P648_9DEIO
MPTIKTTQALPLLAALLAGCAGLTPPAPAPVLTMTRPDADHARATLTPAPARARWTLQPSAECGSPPGPARSGDWPGAGPLLVRATPADLLTVQGDGWQVADCVPGDGD